MNGAQLPIEDEFTTCHSSRYQHQWATCPVGAADSTMCVIKEPGSADSMHGMMNGTLTDLQWRAGLESAQAEINVECLFVQIHIVLPL
jgi:hypothetical protein